MTNEIIAALAKYNFRQLQEIREALDARAEAIKAEFMAQAEAMGLACHDGNGLPRKRRAKKNHDEADHDA